MSIFTSLTCPVHGGELRIAVGAPWGQLRVSCNELSCPFGGYIAELPEDALDSLHTQHDQACADFATAPKTFPR